MIEVKALHKSFGKVDAVNGVSFCARDGEITGLLGPNGAGKTTTLRMLYTLLQPDSGAIEVDGINPQQQAQVVRASMGVVPDAKGLYQRLTARENIRYFAQLQGVAEPEISDNIEQLSHALDMESFIDRRTDGFSQGQRVKVAIARALVHQPQNLLLDEPGNGLDVMSTRALRTFIREQRDNGRCVLFSSHILQEVAELCDRVIIIATGKVIAEGSPTELIEQAGKTTLEDAFVTLVGSGEGIAL
ncbi:ATP-binding cassette domain-containing protein [bacterium SCSIO 12696]|nr:ATP-binding cassette domain-containing protein [bacterium SCSIO 12696]